MRTDNQTYFRPTYQYICWYLLHKTLHSCILRGHWMLILQNTVSSFENLKHYSIFLSTTGSFAFATTMSKNFTTWSSYIYKPEALSSEVAAKRLHAEDKRLRFISRSQELSRAKNHISQNIMHRANKWREGSRIG